ncbi:MAG: ATP phosphoribosyltransferase regulatory subunit, partial [Clostridia bacterium]|nr:ATP phosphoribosyltransferase regulatory subunit [Clostridia bacterium]
NVPKNVLSGGRYDNLLSKLGKSGGACGFAVYVDLIELYGTDAASFKTDVAVIYGENDDVRAVEKLADSYRAKGKTVTVSKNGDDVAADEKIKFNGTGAKK